MDLHTRMDSNTDPTDGDSPDSADDTESNDPDHTDRHLDAKARAVLDVIRREWRANPYHIREQTDLSKGDVNTALNILSKESLVTRRTRGLYEYVGPNAHIPADLRENLPDDHPCTHDSISARPAEGDTMTDDEDEGDESPTSDE